MSQNSKVSIVIPVYNGSNFLREAIDSALSQTYKNIEVLVVNDGSQDGGKTEAIAKSYGDKIRYFLKENGGVASALNFGIRRMEGQYFSWLSHDDCYLPDKIQVQMDRMMEEGRDVIFYTDYILIDGESRFIKRIRIAPIAPGDLRYTLIVSSPLHGCSLLIPRACFEAIGVFNESLRTAQDNDLWFRISAKYEFKHISQALIKSRLHREQGSRTLSKVAYEESTQLYKTFVKQLFDENPSPSKIFKVVYGLIFKERLEAASYALDLGLKKLDNQCSWPRVRIWINTAFCNVLLVLAYGVNFVMRFPGIKSFRHRVGKIIRNLR